MVDQTVLSYKGKRRDALVGTLSSGWTADALDTPEWNRFKSDYRASFEDAFPAPSFFAFSYYSNVKANAKNDGAGKARSEEHTSELQSLMRRSNAVFCLQKKKQLTTQIES